MVSSMNSNDKQGQSPIHFITDGSQDAAAIIAINEDRRRRQIAAIVAGADVPAWMPHPRPVYVEDGSAEAATYIAIREQQRRRSNVALFSSPVEPAKDRLPVLLSQVIITPTFATSEGQLIRAVTLPLQTIVEAIGKDPSIMYQIDPRKWEEIVAASYAESGQFDEVILTPRSGDHGKDLIAIKKGFGAIRIVESVKRYTPRHYVEASDVDALIGVINKQPHTSKGIISTTWEFAPKIMDDPDIARLVPYRVQLVNGTELVERLKAYTLSDGTT